MTIPRSVKFNTLERAIATDLNRVGTLTGKAVLDRELAFQAGMQDTFLPCVTRGLAASSSSGMVIDISAGEALIPVTSPTADQAAIQLGVLLAPTTIELEASPVTNRFDLVYAVFSNSDTDLNTRQILTLSGPAVASLPVNKTRQPTLTLAKVSGSDAVNPTVPSAPAGSIALWYFWRTAGDVTINSDRILDARVQHNPWGLRLQHGIENGCKLYRNNNTSLGLTAGTAWVLGARVNLASSSVYTPTGLLPGGALAADTTYHAYLVTRGNGSLLALSATASVAISTIAPNSNGTPSAPITYIADPAFGLISASTSKALYLGTVFTTAAAQFEDGNPGQPASPGGGTTDMLLDVGPTATFGMVGSPNCWLRPPVMSWVSVTQVNFTPCFALIRGVPVSFPGTTISVGSNLFPGDVLSATTFYYTYARFTLDNSANGLISRSRRVEFIISSEAPNSTGGKPTPGTNRSSNDYLFCGSFLTDGISAIVSFVREFGFVRYTGLASLGGPFAIPVFPTRLICTAFAPPTSTVVEIIASIYTVASVLPLVTQYSIFSATGEPVNQLRFDLIKDTENSSGFSLIGKVGINPSSEFEISRSVSSGTVTVSQVTMHQTGYAESIP